MKSVKPLTDKEILAQIVNIISKYLPRARIILFGSRAKGISKPTSDFDIAIDIKGEVPVKLKFKITDEIENLPTLKMVDIVYIYELDPEFRRIVVSTGKIIYDGSKISVE